MASYTSIDGFLAALPGMAEEARLRLKGQSGLFALTTKQGRRLFLRLEDGVITLPETVEATPDCEVTADEKDLLAVINGELNPVAAILFGRVRVKGDKTLLLKLAALR